MRLLESLTDVRKKEAEFKCKRESSLFSSLETEGDSGQSLWSVVAVI